MLIAELQSLSKGHADAWDTGKPMIDGRTVLFNLKGDYLDPPNARIVTDRCGARVIRSDFCHFSQGFPAC